jgi:hypothetical protein
MERKRDKNGRFAKKEQTEKKELTSKEYEAKIAKLEEKIEAFASRESNANISAHFWHNKFDTERERFELAKELGNKRGEAIEWLLSKVPFWTRNKFWKKFGVL